MNLQHERIVDDAREHPVREVRGAEARQVRERSPQLHAVRPRRDPLRARRVKVRLHLRHEVRALIAEAQVRTLAAVARVADLERVVVREDDPAELVPARLVDPDPAALPEVRDHAPAVPAEDGVTVHLVMDNYATHKHADHLLPIPGRAA